MHLPGPALLLGQLAAIAFVVLVSPLYRGLLERFKARLMFRQGPPVLQPYRDLRKWFAKERLRTVHTSWVSSLAPVLYALAPVLVTMLIPALTAFPLPFAFMGDMLGGGFILSAGGVLLLLAALDAGSAFSALGVSRVRLVGVFAEPLTYLSVFVAATVAGTTIPFVVNQDFARSPYVWNPAHALVVIAWFLLLLAETGRIPVDNPSSAQELALIDPARVFESSGADLALYEWGGWMKFMVLGLILVNVLGSPFGLATSLNPFSLVSAAVFVLGKLLVLGVTVVLLEVSFAKLRLLRIPEYLVASSIAAFLAVVVAILTLPTA